MASGNIQEQLNRLRASLDPNNNTGTTPTSVPHPYAPQLGAVNYEPRIDNIMPLSAMTGVQAPYVPPKATLVKKYGKYLVLAAVVVLLGVLFMKRRRAMMGKKNTSTSASAGKGGGGMPPPFPGFPQQQTPSSVAVNPFHNPQQRQIPTEFNRQSGPPLQYPGHHQQYPGHHQQHPGHHQQHPVHHQQQQGVPLPGPSTQVNDPNFTSL